MNRAEIGFDRLRKGDVILPERIERAYGVTREQHQAFQFATLNLCGAIEAETGMLARVDGETVRVMTDDEAEDHTYRNIINSTKRIARNERRRRENIDTTKLADIARYESRQRVAAALAASQKRELEKQRTLLAIRAATMRGVSRDDLEDDDAGETSGDKAAE